jgi:hypothetical protein
VIGDYYERAQLFLNESKRLREEYDRKEKRRMLWLGKFAFPKVDTKKTKLLFVPPDYNRYYIPIIEPLSIIDYSPTAFYNEPKRAEIDLSEWGYDGKRWRAIIRFGYYEKDDVLIVCKETFVYQQRHRVSDGSSWWF